MGIDVALAAATLGASVTPTMLAITPATVSSESCAWLSSQK